MFDKPFEARVEQRVFARLPDGSSIEGIAFLQARTLERAGGEAVIDLLNRPTDFFSIKEDGGGFVLLNKNNLLDLRVNAIDGARELGLTLKDVLDEQYTRVEVCLINGDKLKGKMPIDLPANNPLRALDWMNIGFCFVCLLAEDEIIYLPRSSIAWMRETGEEPKLEYSISQTIEIEAPKTMKK